MVQNRSCGQGTRQVAWGIDWNKNFWGKSFQNLIFHNFGVTMLWASWIRLGVRHTSTAPSLRPSEGARGGGTQSIVNPKL